MSDRLPFAKMHGLGNSFVLVDDRAGALAGRDALAYGRLVCDPRRGVGADGLLIVGASRVADLAMRVVNADGSEAEMCGNGVRCFARFARDRGLHRGDELAVETLAGVIRTRLLADGRVEVDMGEPSLRTADVVAPGDGPAAVEVGGRLFRFVSMGNPHAIAFVDDLGFDWIAEGAAVERSAPFPHRTNVEFVRVLGPRAAEVKVFERGCGPTQACGTGACAVAVAGALDGKLERAPVRIGLPGGELTIEWAASGRVMMTGPVTHVCDGELLI